MILLRLLRYIKYSFLCLDHEQQSEVYLGVVNFVDDHDDY